MKTNNAIIPIDRDIHAIAKWCARRRGITLKRLVEQAILFEEGCITDNIQRGLKPCGCELAEQCKECAQPDWLARAADDPKVTRIAPRNVG